MPGRSYLFTKASSGMPRARATWKSCSVCASTPRAASIRITAQSTAASTRRVSSEKSLWPGVSSRLKTTSSCSKRSAVELTEMPRRCSTSIQSDFAVRRPPRPLTEPASSTAPAYSSSFSVSVVLPASGCEMIANVRRRAASRTIRPVSSATTAGCVDIDQRQKPVCTVREGSGRERSTGGR